MKDYMQEKMKNKSGKDTSKSKKIQEKDASVETMIETTKQRLSKAKRDSIIIGVLVFVLALGWYGMSAGWDEKMKGIFSQGDQWRDLSSVESLDTESVEQFSYALGASFGSEILGILEQAEGQGEEILAEGVVQGLREAILGEENPAMSEEQIQELFQKKAGDAFVKEYENREGVQKTASGVLYTVKESGDGVLIGKQTALATYEGSLIDGTVFDSSEQHGGDPVPFSSAEVIPGFGEALERMRVGDSWEIVIPSELAYGMQGSGPAIGPNETLIFTVTITGIQTQESE